MAFVDRFQAEVIGAYRWPAILLDIPPALRHPKGSPAVATAAVPPASPTGAPTRTLRRGWVDGTTYSQRYGWGLDTSPDTEPEHPTERLPPAPDAG